VNKYFALSSAARNLQKHPTRAVPKFYHPLFAMERLIHLLFAVQMLCNQSLTHPISFSPGELGSQTLQFTITVYVVSSESVVSPFIIILAACGLYVFGVIKIILDLAIERARIER